MLTVEHLPLLVDARHEVVAVDANGQAPYLVCCRQDSFQRWGQIHARIHVRDVNTSRLRCSLTGICADSDLRSIPSLKSTKHLPWHRLQRCRPETKDDEADGRGGKDVDGGEDGDVDDETAMLETRISCRCEVAEEMVVRQDAEICRRRIGAPCRPPPPRRNTAGHQLAVLLRRLSNHFSRRQIFISDELVDDSPLAANVSKAQELTGKTVTAAQRLCNRRPVTSTRPTTAASISTCRGSAGGAATASSSKCRLVPTRTAVSRSSASRRVMRWPE